MFFVDIWEPILESHPKFSERRRCTSVFEHELGYSKINSFGQKFEPRDARIMVRTQVESLPWLQ
jgi:hypothetical protein